MRKVSVSAFVLITICLGLTCKLSAQNSAKDHLITVDVQKDTYVYSETIPITIKYKNNGTNEWRLRKPDNALSIKVYYGYTGDPEKAFRYTMGKTESIPGPGLPQWQRAYRH